MPGGFDNKNIQIRNTRTYLFLFRRTNIIECLCLLLVHIIALFCYYYELLPRVVLRVLKNIAKALLDSFFDDRSFLPQVK